MADAAPQGMATEPDAARSVTQELSDVVPDELVVPDGGGNPAFRDSSSSTPRSTSRRTRTRRRSVVEIGRGALAKVKGTGDSGGSSHRFDDADVDLDSILALSDEQLEDKLSDKVLTLLKRSTDDQDQPPPVDAIQLLVDGASRQSSYARAAMVDFLRRRLFSDVVVVRRKALLTLKLLLQYAGHAILPTLRANEVALLDIQAMVAFEDVDADGSTVSQQVASVREAAAAVLVLVEGKKNPSGKLSSLTKTVSGVGSGAIGGVRGFRDAQKQKLIDAKEHLLQSHESQGFGELSNDMRLELEAAVAERDEPLDQETLSRFASIATEEKDRGGVGELALRWLIASSEQAQAALVKHKALQMITAMLGSESLVLVDITSDSQQIFNALVDYGAVDDPRVPSCRREDDAAELAVREVQELAAGIVRVLQQAQERVLMERRKRRAEAAKAREELEKMAAVESPKLGIEQGAMLLLLECTLDDERPAPVEAVTGLISALQNAAVHAEIKKDMVSFRANEQGELYGSGTLSDWAKCSPWSSDTGGEKDENGAPIRAQQGIWLEMWESVIASEDEAETDEQETVLLLRTPKSLVHFLNDMIKVGAVNKKVKALQLMKNLYSVQDPCFVAAVQAHSTPFISELLEYRCVPHPQYGDKPMLRVRKLARLLLEEIHPKLREQRLEEIRRRQAQTKSAAAGGESPRVLGKLGLRKKTTNLPASETAQDGLDQQVAKRARAAQLAKVMFMALDQDQDGVLLCHEVQELARKTGGSLTKDQYVTVCMQVGSTGREGINEQQLLSVYLDLKMGNIEQDFVLMGLEVPETEPESEPEPEPELHPDAAHVATASESPSRSAVNESPAAAPAVEEGEPPEQ